MTELFNRYHRRYRPGSWEAGLDRRTEGERDRARIEAYSTYFRRLGQKTQIIGPSSTLQVTHSRKDHATKVADFGEAAARHLLLKPRGFDTASRLGGVDAAVVRAAGAAHDLGHPPFGHAGEKVLDEWCQERGLDGFEGNAQSYRIVTKLEDQPKVEVGADLTFATQNAMLKYPVVRADVAAAGAKWGVYASERVDFELARRCLPGPRQGETAVEAQIMDFADDMSYALHDFDDFVRVRTIDVARLPEPDFWIHDGIPGTRLAKLSGVPSRPRFDNALWERACTSVAAYFQGDGRDLCEPWKDSKVQRTAIKAFTSRFLTLWLDGLSLDPARGLVIDPFVWHQVNAIKQMTFDRVISAPELGVRQLGSMRVVRDLAEFGAQQLALARRSKMSHCSTRLWELFLLAVGDADWSSVEPDRSEDMAAARAVSDFVSELTEPQAMDLFQVLSGTSQAIPMSGDWIA